MKKKRKRHLASKFIRQEFYDNAIARDKDKDTSIASNLSTASFISPVACEKERKSKIPLSK